MKPFAKLYETERGQIVVLRDKDSEENPAIVFMFDPGVEALAVCRLALGFQDSNEGENQRDAAFEALTEDGVRNVVFNKIDAIKEMFGDTP